MRLVHTLWARLLNCWSHRPTIDYALAALTTLALASWQRHHILTQHSQDQRMNIYATVASVAAIVGGFGTAAISQYATSSGRRMAFLRELYGHHLRRNWVGLLTSMLTVSGGCLGVMLIDTKSTLGWPGWVVEGLITLGFYRSFRLVWLFRLLIDVSDHDAGNSGRGQTVDVLEIRRD
ncbi:hypothetical protein [Streptomyces platensis]|uniref:hypothetical protein n=1 Tax=Streptomyces platensis TaxID=58346 RepID=UPI001F31167F|nr:hypothetical protein [Streptomyces platensis]MCF3148587.1 hypothetical protein [Streptomyces platensis]